MTTYAYLRVSTDNKGQTTDNQKKVIKDMGLVVDQWVSEEGVSGTIRAFERPAFSEMLSKMVSGDTMILVAIDRLGRTASDILNVIEEMTKRGIKIRVAQFDGIDITSAMGKMIITCMSAMAELERNILVERTRAGLARTKEQGTRLGPPLTIAPDTLREMVKRKATATLDTLHAEFGIPRNTIARNIREWSGKLEEYEAEWEVRQRQYGKEA